MKMKYILIFLAWVLGSIALGWTHLIALQPGVQGWQAFFSGGLLGVAGYLCYWAGESR